MVSGGGVPWILKNLKSNSETVEVKEISPFSLGSSENSSIILPKGDERSVDIQMQKSREMGNCVVLDNSAEITDILWHFGEQVDDYITVFCQDTNLTTSVKISDWTGMFPADFIANGWNLRVGNRFNITTETKTLDLGHYQTIFDGNRISYPITGEWSNAIKTDKGKSVTVVKVADESQSIYLLFNEQTRKQ